MNEFANKNWVQIITYWPSFSIKHFAESYRSLKNDTTGMFFNNLRFSHFIKLAIGLVWN